MPLVFLDTNPIIRYLTQDDPGQAARARDLFEQAARGEVTLYVSESVVVEVVNVLSSRVTYHLPRREVVRHLGNIFSLRGFKIPGKQTYRRALELWVNTPSVRDFVDALSVAQAERLKIPTIASFDTDFDRFPTIKRLQP
ncbi:MAG: PIN domain-containing protein [Chloroflexi bacterium]|nr:PIN domain-containing protein [Chloroflexota bacterium]MBI4505630.1 PIN domain-containing protein [Chloroflexota bacterium]